MPDDPSALDRLSPEVTPNARGWTPLAPEEIARLLPGYDVLSLLGRGGMGAVYLAVQRALDRAVAIKLLPLEVSADPDFADRFVREAQAMAKLHHPHLIEVHDFGKTSEGQLYIVMEYVDGANLHEMIHGAGLPPAQALHIAAQVCEALAYAHAQGVVHRDIKPANVMVDQRGQAKVADFGLARLIDPTAEHLGTTGTGTIMGTPDYMAPEQRKGMHVDHRADIYSVGVMIYEMLCGEVPRRVFEPPSRRVECDTRVDQVVTRAMQQEPRMRYQSTQEMKTDVDAARTPMEKAESEKERRFPTAGENGGAGTTAVKNRRSLVWAIAACALAAGAFFVWKQSKKQSAALSPSPSLQASLSPALTAATKDAPFVNTFGMKFVPVPITGGPTGGQRVLFSVWGTRVQDYATFATETQRDWEKPEFEQGPTHPAVMVSWADATAFCAWLTERERKAGTIGANERYRLPSDHEWSCGVGIGDREDPAMLPVHKDKKLNGIFPWDSTWPPPDHTGNYQSEELQPAREAGNYPWMKGSELPGYHDGFAQTSPVDTFTANRFGLHDMGGNVWQWCEDWFDSEHKERVLRGASWVNGSAGALRSSYRNHYPTDERRHHCGFRCVLAGPSSARTAAPPR